MKFLGINLPKLVQDLYAENADGKKIKEPE